MFTTTFGPWPAQFCPEVTDDLRAIAETNVCSLSHRSKEFSVFSEKVHIYLKKLLNIPPTHKIFYTASATDAMEITIRSFVLEHSYHFTNGVFSNKFFDVTVPLGKKSQKQELPLGQGNFDYTRIPKETELISVTHSETTTGVMVPRETILHVKKNNPDKLLAVDITSSVGSRFPDISTIDVTLFSVQKGLGMPAWLGVMIVSADALAKYEIVKKAGKDIWFTHNIDNLLDKNDVYQTHETPNVLVIYLLGKQLERMRIQGKETIEKETQEKYMFLNTFFTNHPICKPFVTDETYRSSSVFVINLPKEHQEEMKKKLDAGGILLGAGYGPLKDTTLRIANFPALTREDMQKMTAVFAEYTG